MVHSWATLSLLLGCAQGLRKARTASDAAFDSSGCTGAACGSLSSTKFDFVVVGSGAGGGPLAARLAEAGNNVLVLEAGVDSGDMYEYQIPAWNPTATETPDLAWHYFVQHYENQTRAAQDTKMTPKGILYPRGGALGGSTAVNAMIQVLPQVSGWDRVAALTGDSAYQHSNMNQYEYRLDEWVPKDNIPLTNLLVDIFNPTELSLLALTRLLKVFDAGFEEVGESLGGGAGDGVSKLIAYANYLTKNINDELRVGNVEGAYTFPVMIRDGQRNGARERLLGALTTGKLTIQTQALVTRVEFGNANANGGCNGPCHATEVVYLNGRRLYGAEMNPSSSASPRESRVSVRSSGEIILSAGAFNTPQLLKQSGIGPKAELERFGIPVHVDLVGVGENLQDRYEVGIETEFYDKNPPFDPLPFLNPDDCNYKSDRNDDCFRHWSDNGKGLYGTNGGLVALLKSSGLACISDGNSCTEVSDLHVFGVPGPFLGYVPGYSSDVTAEDTRHKFTWVVLKGQTDNRGGTVKLRCSRKSGGKCVLDPRATPDINFHYFSEGVEYDELNTSKTDSKGDRDLEATVRAIEMVRRIQDTTNRKLTRSTAIESWPGEKFAPGENFASETDKLREFVVREAWGHHASCTAPMGCLPSSEVGSHNSGAGICQKTAFNENTVLDSRYRVRGTKGLRVVDASAWPRIPGTFLLLPTYIMSEKAAANIVEDHQGQWPLCRASSTGPDNDGDCACNTGLTCYEDGHAGCRDSYTGWTGQDSRTHFLLSCTSCRCQ